MKFATLCVLFLSATALRIQGSHIDGKEVALITEGFLEGAFEGIFPVAECIQDAEEMVQDFENAYFEFKKGISVDHVEDALKQIGKAVEKMPAAIADCKSCTGIISRVETIAALFANPVHFLEKVGKNILWHFKDITGDVKQAREDWETGQWKEFGLFCGKIAAIALKMPAPPAPQMGVTDAAKFFEGFFVRAAGSCGDISTCISTSQDLTNLVESLANEFKGKFGFDNIKNIVTDIEQILEIIPVELATCPQVPAEALKIVAVWTKEFSDIVGTSEKVVKALWSHHKELFNDATDFTASIAAENFYQAGTDLADFIEIILGPAL